MKLFLFHDIVNASLSSAMLIGNAVPFYFFLKHNALAPSFTSHGLIPFVWVYSMLLFANKTADNCH
jgi:hypothetical protein